MNSTRAEIEERGFSIVPRIFLQHETDNLIHHLEESELRRSKAGIRHALKNDAVRTLRLSRGYSALRKKFWVTERFLFVQLCLINHPEQTG
jgi:hypothetical protein